MNHNTDTTNCTLKSITILCSFRRGWLLVTYDVFPMQSCCRLAQCERCVNISRRPKLLPHFWEQGNIWNRIRHFSRKGNIHNFLSSKSCAFFYRSIMCQFHKFSYQKYDTCLSISVYLKFLTIFDFKFCIEFSFCGTKVYLYQAHNLLWQI